MGWGRDVGDLGWRAIKGTLLATADVAVAGKNAVIKRQDKIAAAGTAIVLGTGSAVGLAGSFVKQAADAGAVAAYDNAGRTDNKLGKAVAVAAALLAEGVGLIGTGTGATGEMIGRSGKHVGAALGGVVTGAVALTSEAIDSVALQQSDLQRLREELAAYGEVALDRSERNSRRIEAAIRRRRKKELLDLYIVGGIGLAEVVRTPGRVPAEVQTAFEAAYPDLATVETFAEAVDRMQASELPGLVAGVKGKLFEQELVEYLNDGNLPDGFTAGIAPSATQPGWDISVIDEQGTAVELLQARATESVDYVRDAIERYPDIDIVSTSEVYAQMAALGLAEQVRDGGITEAALEATVQSAANVASGGVDATDLMPSTLGLAIIGLSVFMDKSLAGEQRAAEFGSRSGRVGVASVAAKSVMIATQTWWLGLMVGAGSHWLATKGRGKREQYEALEDMVDIVRKRENRIKRRHAKARRIGMKSA